MRAGWVRTSRNRPAPTGSVAGGPVNLLALGDGVAAAVNLAWPRAAEGVAWYDQSIVLIGLGVVLGTGLVYMVAGRPYRRGTTPAGDAAQLSGRPARRVRLAE